MKQAYVSVVLSAAELPDPREIERLDKLLEQESRLHEIIAVVPHSADPQEYERMDLSGPFTSITTHVRATPDAAVIAGLSRAVGDFVVEWRGEPTLLDAETLARALHPTDGGGELVELTGTESSTLSKAFYRAVNSLRPRAVPVRKTVGRTYSRHCLGQLLSANAFEPQLDVLSAELPVHRSVVSVDAPNPHRKSFVERLAEGGTLLSKGTRFGSTIPLSLAAVSAFFGVAAALYALGVLVLRGRTPEGWTTLMVVIGLGQAAILAMLGMVWTRIDAMARGFSTRRDATGGVTVVPPTRERDSSDQK
ncbi:MAG: hypothetical protein R2720_02800 [Candidatus Nanopelagicales bacterium]